MTYFSLFILLSMITIIHIIKPVSGLNAEAIVNGLIANQSDFQYQAAIFGREDIHSVAEIICNGAIVAANWILSVAHCFMINSKQPKNYIFTAIVGSDNFTDSHGFIQDIVMIYTDDCDYGLEYNDIAMAKTADSLPIQLNRVAIPNPNESFVFRTGVVSGYGWSTIVSDIDEDDNVFYFENKLEIRLRYTSVKIFPSFLCADEFPFQSHYNRFCGLTEMIGDEYTGVCVNDDGSPLVIDDKVVGLVVANHDNCDDTEHGSLYIDVSQYFYFIRNVILNISMDSVVMRSLV